MKDLKFNKHIEDKINQSHYKQKTIKAFKSWYSLLYKFVDCSSLSVLSINKLEDFIVYLKEEKGYSVSSIRQAINALEFLFNEIYGKNYHFSQMKIRRPEREIPISIPKSDLKIIIDSITNPKHKLAISIIYGCGLDIGEAITIKLSDIDSKDQTILIHNEKGTRRTTLGRELLDLIRNYYSIYKPKEYLFESFNNEAAYSNTSIRNIFNKAKKNVPNSSEYTMKNLKYSYVKHLQDEGFQITDILKHIGLNSYEIYSKINNEKREINYSPLDTLYGKKDLSTIKLPVTDEQVENLLFTDSQAKNFLAKNPNLIKIFIENELTDSDITAVGYRKKELQRFEALLFNPDFFNLEMDRLSISKKEALWQHFFENNTWIFGYGLNFIFSTPLEGKKIEQVVAGFNFNSAGKRVDGLLKTRGLISSLCFVEIKTHKTDLLNNSSYRSECWSISPELSGAVAQIQKTVQKAINTIPTQTGLKDSQGNLTGERVFLYSPKSYLIIGSLSEFVNEFGVNEDKYSSFELFRQNIQSPEIITFDELYERAKYLIHSQEEK